MCNRDVKMLLSMKISGDITSVEMTFGQLDRNADQIMRLTH